MVSMSCCSVNMGTINCAVASYGDALKAGHTIELMGHKYRDSVGEEVWARSRGEGNDGSVMNMEKEDA